MEQTAQPYPAHAIVVLGGGVLPDGSLPRAAQNRVDRAVEIFRLGVAPRIILSGRCSLSAAEEPAVTEAEAMARYAVSLGVPREALLLEEASKDTLGNAYFVKRFFLQPNGWRIIRIVTSDFHLSRAAWVFRKILGAEYDFSFVSAPSELSPPALVQHALEECKIYIFLVEWLQAVTEADDDALTHLMQQDHFGYAEAPGMTMEAMQRRLDEIARISGIVGDERWRAGAEAARRRLGAPGEG